MADLKSVVKSKAVAAAAPAKTLSSQFEALKPEIRKLAGHHTDKLVRLAMNQARTNLQDCSVRSILGAVMSSAAVGLEPSPLGHVWLIPFRNGKTGETECQFQIGVRGWIKLARNAGCFLDAKCVYENDAFSYEYGFEPSLTHIPAETNRGKLRCVYAIAKDRDGNKYLEVMSLEEVDKIRKVSKAGQSGPWVDWYDQMALKTAIKRLAKMLPLDTTFEKARAYDSTTNVLSRVEDEYGNALPAPSLNPKEIVSIQPQALTPTIEGQPVDESGWTQTEMIAEEPTATDIFAE